MLILLFGIALAPSLIAADIIDKQISDMYYYPAKLFDGQDLVGQSANSALNLATISGSAIAPVLPVTSAAKDDTMEAPSRDKSLLKRRNEYQEKRKVPNFLRSLGFAAIGFTLGILLGFVIGAALGAAFVLTSPNPKIKKAKWLLAGPAAVLGGIMGQIVMPFAFAWFGSKSEPYDDHK
ncbi:hypothetical protein ACFL6Y_03815 [Elusimicrobiota bacterium]